jgi:hypothetical protein
MPVSSFHSTTKVQLAFAAFVLVAASSAVAQAANPFVLVLIDKKTEDAMGPFPYDRSVLAAAVERSAALQAKGVVLKFFLNLPRREQGDRALAAAMRKTKVLLQTGNPDDNTPVANQLPDRFKLGPVPFGDAKAVTGSRGGIPLAMFTDAAYAIGLVDIVTAGPLVDRVPMIEAYGDRYVESLTTACLELALSGTASFQPGASVRFGSRSIELDAQSRAMVRFPESDNIAYISLVDYLGSAPRPEVKDRIVIIGADVVRMPTLPTRAGPIRPHRLFYCTLLSLYQDLIAPKPAAPGRKTHP